MCTRNYLIQLIWQQSFGQRFSPTALQSQLVFLKYVIDLGYPKFNIPN